MQKIKNYFADFNRYEKIWVWSFITIILSVTIYFSATSTDYTCIEAVMLNWVIAPIAAISGIFCVVMAAKGKFSHWIWGIIMCILYGFMAFRAGIYGDAIVNIFYFLPTQFIGIVMWRKMQKRDKTKDVIKRRLTGKQFLAIGVVGVAFTVLFALFLHNVDNWFTQVMYREDTVYTFFHEVLSGGRFELLGPLLDASTETLQIVAQILLIFAYAQQWILWIAVNVITIIMWVAVIMQDPTRIPWALPTLIMWIAFLINSIYGCRVWMKESKENENRVVSR